jgi:hypothetical protein
VAKENFTFTNGEDPVTRYESESLPATSAVNADPASMTTSAATRRSSLRILRPDARRAGSQSPRPAGWAWRMGAPA